MLYDKLVHCEESSHQCQHPLEHGADHQASIRKYHFYMIDQIFLLDVSISDR